MLVHISYMVLKSNDVGQRERGRSEALKLASVEIIKWSHILYLTDETANR